MTAIDEIREHVREAVGELLSHLEDTQQHHAQIYFMQLESQLAAVKEEEDLLELCMFLSTMAFQGFALDPMGAMMADRLLLYAEQISHTFSVAGDTPL